jgi:hypothetical protein
MAVDHQDPEQRIAELERQLAEQQRINELQQRLADAQAASGQPWSVNPPMQSGGPFPEADQNAREYAQNLLNSLRSGNPNAVPGLRQPDIDRLRAVFSQAASQAGISPQQLDEALKHADVNVSTSHWAFYPQQGNAAGAAPPVAGWGPPPPQAAGVTYGQPALAVGRPRRGVRASNVIGAILLLTFMFGFVGTFLVPSTALWTSPIVCGGSDQLSHTSEYSNGHGTSIDFHCAGDDQRTVSIYLITGLQCVAALPVAGLVVLAWRSIRRSR